MTDTEASPLSDDERAELEALRAEKARREEEERARQERAELEALRAEQQCADAAKTRKAERPAPAKAAPRPVSTQKKPVVDPDHLTFGQKMVLGNTNDDEDIPGMPPAQKLIVGLALLFVAVGAVWMFLH